MPEFTPTFDRFVAEEEGEFGSFWAMDELHRWAFPQNDAEPLRPASAAVDELYADDSLPDGDPLAIEFFEAVCAAGGRSTTPTWRG